MVEEALIAAITNGHIRGAALDVYDGEGAGRPPRAELVELPQILPTPHTSGRGDTLMAELLERLFAGDPRRFLDGEPILTMVDSERGYQRCRAASRPARVTRSSRSVEALALLEGERLSRVRQRRAVRGAGVQCEVVRAFSVKFSAQQGAESPREHRRATTHPTILRSHVELSPPSVA
ncbi:MAG: NAD(P)-dependent oxidoreductase [Acidimicrobiales bacterium]